MAKKFDFLSPGIEIREIDQSFIPAEREAAGPIIIGRTRKGPANKPVKVRNLDDFVTVFGLPVPGGAGAQGDVWRDGNTTGPTYASYAAQAWLASENSPVTIVRLAGDQHPQNDGSVTGLAGWKLSGSVISTDQTLNSTAYGLFLCASGTTNFGTGSLAAVFYADEGHLTLNGQVASVTGETVSEAGTFVRSAGNNCEFKLDIYNNASTLLETVNFNFSRNSSRYIRSTFNTNPQLVNDVTVGTNERKTYWLGESFTREVVDLSLDTATAGNVFGILLPLGTGTTATTNWSYHKEGAQEAYTGWIVSQKAKGQTDLFRLKTLHVGEDLQQNYMVAIEDIREPTNPVVNPYGTFTVSIKNMSGQSVERYVGCNLNPSSIDYVGRRIGDQYIEWDETNRRYRTYGDYQNNSDLVYVDIKQFIKDGGGQGYLPAGFKGPVRPKGFTLCQGSVGANALGTHGGPGSYASGSVTAVATGGAAVDGKTLIMDDGLHSPVTITLTGAGTAVTRTNATTYSVGTGSIASAANLQTRLYNAINTIFTNADTVIKPVSSGGAILEMTSSIAGTFINTKTFTGTLISQGSASVSNVFRGGTDSDDFSGAFVQGNNKSLKMGGTATLFASGPQHFTASFNFPSIALRGDGVEGGAPDPYRAYYGIRPKLSTTSNTNDPDYCDYLRRLPNSIDNFAPASADYEHSFVFTLDDLVVNTTNNTVDYTSGSYGSTSYTTASGSFGDLLDLNVRQFLMPLHGGFEGWDITEKEPIRDGLISSTRNDKGDYIHYTLNKAIDSIKDPEVVPANLLLMPGVREPAITNRLISVAGDRKDVLAIIDIENDYMPLAERLSGESESNSLGSVKSAVSTLKGRNLNSSYACTFYPWIQASDNLNGGQLVWLPPSVAGLGAMAKSQAQSELWFAPAGFNRGGLGSLGGSRGPSVVQARQRLDSSERDSLYEVNINPIATFPAEGVVIFGQKTLQAGQSALDRINVRRLLLFLKAEVSEISRNLLFDQNVESTWNRFKAQVNPVLASTKARFGLSDYKLILDDTTTTADLVDRNIMYAKIFIKPARAIEYIVVDFVITRTGADFA